VEKIRITGRDWDMSGWPREEITVAGIVSPLEGCGDNDDRAAVVDAYGRELRIIGVRRHGGRVELVVDADRAAAAVSGIPEWIRSQRRALRQCELCGEPAVCEHHDAGNGRDELLCGAHLNSASDRIAARRQAG
jgi:hypothetical protein